MSINDQTTVRSRSGWAASVHQFGRYCVAGGTAAALHFGVLIVLVESFSVAPTWASAIGFCMAVMLNYILQYRWTFNAEGEHSRLVWRFALFTGLTLGINTGVFWACDVVAGLPYLLAQVIAIGVVVAINYQLNRRYVFVTAPASR